MDRIRVITCAVTGSFDSPAKNPAVPVTPQAIADSALDAAKAGAAIVHIHVRDPDTAKPSMELAAYREVVDRIRERDADVIINLTCGAGGRFVLTPGDPTTAGPGSTLSTPEVRMRHVQALRPEICSLDMGSFNFGEHVFVNIPAHLRQMAGMAAEVGTKPELEVFDLGQIVFARKLIAEGHIAEPPLFQICLGIPYGAPATPEVMMQMQAQLPENAIWSGFGIAKAEFPMVGLVASLGGHVRVGLEDNVYISHGVLAPSNAALVEKAAAILASLDYRPATAAEARQIFHL